MRHIYTSCSIPRCTTYPHTYRRCSCLTSSNAFLQYAMKQSRMMLYVIISRLEKYYRSSEHTTAPIFLWYVYIYVHIYTCGASAAYIILIQNRMIESPMMTIRRRVFDNSEIQISTRRNHDRFRFQNFSNFQISPREFLDLRLSSTWPLLNCQWRCGIRQRRTKKCSPPS